MKHIFFRLAFLAILPAILAGGCSRDGKSEDPMRVVVARVNQSAITGGRFLEEYKKARKRMGISDDVSKEVDKALREKVLEKMIETELLTQEAEGAGIDLSDRAREEAVNDLVKGFSPAKLQLELDRSGQTFHQWKQGVWRNLLIENLIRKEVAPRVEIPEKDIREYYEARKEEFNVPEKVRAFHIVVSTLSDADKIRNDIVFGADFEEMARKYSISPDAAEGGDLGVFGKGQMPKEFDNEIFKLKINQVSKVVESPYGFHIFKVTEKFKARSMKYSEAREIIFNSMFNEKLEQEFHKWFAEIRKKADITVYSDRLFRL